MKEFLKKPYIYLIIIVIGIGLKFYKLEQRFFWDDEICTMLHTSGVSMDTYEENIPVNTVFNRSYFDHILALNSRHLSIHDQFRGLMMMPQLTPGNYYYLIFWIRLFGDGYMSYRYFSVVIFLLSLPFLFLLSRRLFQSNIAAWIAVSLYAVSPFFQYYAQEARYYILWALAIVIMDYLLLMAAEKQNRLWWGLYVVAGALAIHTTIMFSLIFLMHIIYYLRFHRLNWKPLFISFGIIFLCALPWLIFIYINRSIIHDSLTWQALPMGQNKIYNIFKWQLDDFVGVLINPGAFIGTESFVVFVRVVVVLLIAAGLYAMIKRATKKQILFVVLATFVGFITLSTIDIVRHSFTSQISRYPLPNYIGLILLLAFAGKTLLQKSTIAFGVLFLVVIVSGIVSSKVTSDHIAVGRYDSHYHVEDAVQLFSGNQHVLIISDYQCVGPYSYSMFMSLIHRCKDKNIDLIYAKPDFPDFAHDFNLDKYDAVYAMYLSDDLTKDLKKCFSDEMVMIKDRTMYGVFHLPVYQIEISKDLTKLQEKQE